MPELDIVHLIRSNDMTLRKKAPRAKARWATLGFTLTAALLVLSATVVASLPGTAFETEDGNLTVEGAEQDWAGVAQCNPPAVTENCENRKADQPTGSGDDSFTQGTKEDTAEPVTETGSIPPNKSDLKNFGIYVEENANGKFVHLFWTRVQEPNGTTNMDFEFNQGAALAPNGVTPLRTAGDLLVTYELSRGGTVPNLFLLEWLEEAADGSCDASNAFPCWGNRVDLDAAGAATGSINQATILSGNADGLGELSARTFGEATIDLDFIFDQSKCTSFGSAYLKSRSSDSFTSALKDFIAPLPVNISNCAKVIIRKETDPDQAPELDTFFGFTKSFTTDPTSSNTFQLEDDGNKTFSNVVLGTGYTVDETSLPTGWDFDSVDCSASTGVTPVIAPGASLVTFTLDDTDDVLDCTYNNIAHGSIVIEKVTNGGAGAFNFGSNPDLPSPAVNGDFTLTTTQSGAAGKDFDTFSGLVAGDAYEVTETVTSGWDLTGITCDSGTYTIGTDGDADFTAGDVKATITVGAGQTITCTYTNTKRGSITIVKNAVPDDPTDFDYSGTSSTDTGISPFMLDDDDTLAVPSALADTTTLTGLKPGTYTVTEGAESGWDLTGLSCTGGTNGTTGSQDVDNPAKANITLTAGGSITCTYTNTKRGGIEITKTDDAGNLMPDIEFALWVDSDPTDGDTAHDPATDVDTGMTCTTDADGECSFTGLLPGDYWVVEDASTVPAGYTAAADQHATVGAGATVSLTFENPRLHNVIVIVCHQGTDTLYAVDITLGSSTETTISAAQLTTSGLEITEADLCGLPGANFGGLGHGAIAPTGNIPVHP